MLKGTPCVVSDKVTIKLSITCQEHKAPSCSARTPIKHILSYRKKIKHKASKIIFPDKTRSGRSAHKASPVPQFFPQAS